MMRATYHLAAHPRSGLYHYLVAGAQAALCGTRAGIALPWLPPPQPLEPGRTCAACADALNRTFAGAVSVQLTWEDRA